MARSEPLTSQSHSSLRALIPGATYWGLALTWLVVAVFQFGASSWFVLPVTWPVAGVSFLVLFSTILGAAVGVVCFAERLAHELGEPYGTLILTLSVVSIEVILITGMMIVSADAATIGRDAIFSVMMIILNLVTGLSIVVGCLRHGEQEYNAQGGVAYVSMILTLTGIALVLPNALGPGSGSFSHAQAIAISAITMLTYAAFLTAQIGAYRRLFVQPNLGSLTIPHGAARSEKSNARNKINHRFVVLRSLALVLFLVPIVLLSHHLALLIDIGIKHTGAPVAIGGVLIAIIVFTPESITAVKASLRNEMQRTINLCLGAFVSTVGLTVPAVLIVGLVTGKTVVLGLTAPDTVLSVLTIGLSALTFFGQRISLVQGILHLALFAVFVLLLSNS